MAITPAPSKPLVRWGGVFASASPHRRSKEPGQIPKKGFELSEKEETEVNDISPTNRNISLGAAAFLGCLV